MSNVLRFLTGFTTCPSCSLQRRPQEERMAVPTYDGRVFCYACNGVTGTYPHGDYVNLHALPKILFDLIHSLMRLDAPEGMLYTHGEVAPDKALPLSYSLVTTNGNRRGQTDYSAEPHRAAAAVAQGNADVLIEAARKVEILLKASSKYHHDSVKIDYFPEALADLQDAVAAADLTDEIREFVKGLPHLQAKAVSALSLSGFSLLHHDLDSRVRHVRLTRGEGDRTVRAELTWYV